ncbi:ABC transporter permease [Photobacterium atrarenae]|uniref:ABC-2 family transporter protein n=1 Tax=Photobacterium atrarenae TaxID=865757 RepID=A0ABY5GDY4_9GAMM|nr:ABC-2 family transporter protein [Photobacterium atrarenae]UTV26934.1 ABC-2 family transporter protein [Photobacterium atrarenae]
MRKYLFVSQMGLQMSLAYRLNYLISVLAAGFPLLLQVMFWHAIFTYTQAEQVYGYRYEEMMAYALFAALVSQALRTGFEYEVATDIKEGGLNRFLTQPLSYSVYRLAAFVGQNLGYFTATLLLIGGCAVLLNHWLQMAVSLSDYFRMLGVLCGAFFIQFFLFYLIGLAAFWMQEVWGVFESIRIVGLVLSGGVFPLTVFGEAGMAVLRYLPFQYVVFFPIEVVLGRVTGSDLMIGVAIQGAWIIGLFSLSRLVWNRGCKHFIALGG